MIHRSAPLWALVGVVAICAPAAAEEQGVIRARLDLNRVETTLERMKQFSEASAQKQLDLIERARGFLAGCSKQDDPAWTTQSERAATLEAAVRRKTAQPAGGAQPAEGPAPNGGAKPAEGAEPKDPAPAQRADPRTRKAKGLVDQVEAKLAELKPGDVRGATRLIDLLKQANDHLKQVRDPKHQAHPDYNGTIRRLAPLDARIRARANEKPAAPAEPKPPSGETAAPPTGPGVERPLSAADQKLLTQAAQSIDEADQSLAKLQGTVFSNPDLSKPTPYAQRYANARVYLGRVSDRENAKLVAAYAKLDASQQRYAAREAESREQLAALHALDDYEAKIQATVADLKANGNARAPRFPSDWSPAQIRTWVTTRFKPGIETTQEQLDFIQRVRLWDPRLRVRGRYHVELKNGTLNAERTALQVLARAKAMTASIEAEARKALKDSADFESKLTVKELRDMARSLNFADFGTRQVVGAVDGLRKALAFHEAMGEVPEALQQLDAEVRARREAIVARVEAQVASERLPAPKAGQEKLQKIAEGFFKEALAVAVSSELETVEGTWTSKSLVSETPAGGDWVRRTYRVENEPYKYDRFWVYVARPLEGREGYVQVWEYGVRKFAFGAKPLGEWYPYVDQRTFVMLAKNLPK